MTDISEVLPDFDLKPWRHLLFSLDKKEVTVLELISEDPLQIARKCPLPPKEVARFANAVLQAIHAEVGFSGTSTVHTGSGRKTSLRPVSAIPPVAYVKTLAEPIDNCLGGGFATGHISEIVGESAVGKTQFVLNLLLSAQLPPPLGLGRPVIYVSTEGPLNTRRLAQMLQTHPRYQAMEVDQRPCLDHVHTIETHDLELQEHIVLYQLPLAVSQIKPGLVVMDSVAANYRAEYSSSSKRALADRAIELVRLGKTLRDLAQQQGLAIVVTNQVSDRFDDPFTISDRLQSSSPAQQSSQHTSKPLAPIPRDELISLDFQQRFITGWGDQAPSLAEHSKTPALGLTWTNQISARIALKMVNYSRRTQPGSTTNGNIWSETNRRRYMSVVFAPWVEPSTRPIEYGISTEGIVSIPEKTETQSTPSDHTKFQDAALLDPAYWETLEDFGQDDEFP